jgi:CRP/FNR family cyclic AMP-dependent transcriptional regulator
MAKGPFDPEVFLTTVRAGRKTRSFNKGQTIFAQGDAADSLFVIREGRVQLRVKSQAGKAATLDILSDQDFIGQDSIAGRSCRTATASALTDCIVLQIKKKDMLLALARHVKLANVFLAYVLAKNIRYEQDLVEQHCITSEKRLARILLLLANHDGHEAFDGTVPRIRHEMLAEMVGTTRSRVCFFMKRFKQSGFIDYKAGGKTLRVHRTLLAFCGGGQ